MNLQLVVVAIVLVCGALTVNASPAMVQQHQQTLFNYLIQSRAAQKDGSYASDCFSYYIPILNDITVAYQTNYNACLMTASHATEALIQLGDESRSDITSVSEEVCKKFNDCRNESENLKFFDCSSNLGDQSVVIYNASKDASEAAANYREEYRTIQVKQERCINETERTYITDHNKAYDDMNDCFINGLDTNVPSTTDATTTSSPPTETPAPTSAPGTKAQSVYDSVKVKLLNDDSTSRHVYQQLVGAGDGDDDGVKTHA